MNRFAIFVLSVLLWSIDACGQILRSDSVRVIKTDSYTETIESSNYVVDGDTVRSKVYVINNISNDTLWVFFEKDDRFTNDYDMVNHRFFYCNPQKGIGRMFSYLLDGNVYFSLNLFGYFFKLIPPEKQFYIIIEGESISEIDSLLSKIRIVTQSFIFDNFKLIKKYHREFDQSVFYTKDYLMVTRRILQDALQK